MDPNPKQHEESASATGGTEGLDTDVLAAMPSYTEHMSGKDETQPVSNQAIGRSVIETMDAQTDFEVEKSPEERQVEDLEVLFSFCDQKDIMEILKSDAYGVLLDNKVSLVDLFNADVLFGEQYYADGYTKEYDERTYGDKLKNFTERRRRNIEDNIDFIRYLKDQGKFEEADKVRSGEAGYLLDDLQRTREAKRTIEEIAGFIENGDWGKMSEAVKVRAEGGELSNEQKEYLANEWGTVPERLLYGGKVINKERAGNILHTLEQCEDEYDKDLRSEAASTREQAGDVLVTRFVYAEGAIRDYEQAGRLDLVADAREKLEELVDAHFDEVAKFQIGSQSSDYAGEAKERLILNYSNPYQLAERLMSYGIRNRNGDEHGGSPEDGAAIYIDNPDLIVDAMTREFTDGKDDPTIYVSEWASQLTELGVSDEAILAKCHDLRPHDFISATSAGDGSGARLVEAGVDQKKIIKEVFSTYWRKDNPFDNSDQMYRGESEVEVLERNGFDITDIAKTYSPDTISKHLNEFLARGADAKALTEYMLNYKETFENNIRRGEDGKEVGLNYLWFDGIQDVIVTDIDHPNGRMIAKEGMPGDGYDYVAKNLDILAEHGVTEEYIIDTMSGSAASPYNGLIPKMLSCPKFDAKRILTLGLEKYQAYLPTIQDLVGEDYVKQASEPSYYYSMLLRHMDDFSRKERDKYYSALD